MHEIAVLFIAFTFIFLNVYTSSPVVHPAAPIQIVDDIVNTGWVAFNFSITGSYVNPGWGFNYSTTLPIYVTITDAYCSGDTFTIYDNGVSILTTTFTGTIACPGVTDPNQAFLSNNQYSVGTVQLGTSTNNHFIQVQMANSQDDAGTAFIRIDAGINVFGPSSPSGYYVVNGGYGYLGYNDSTIFCAITGHGLPTISSTTQQYEVTQLMFTYLGPYTSVWYPTSQLPYPTSGFYNGCNCRIVRVARYNVLSEIYAPDDCDLHPPLPVLCEG